jgi:UDP-N-acetylmuramoylalanine--D-glutamate ligase
MQTGEIKDWKTYFKGKRITVMGLGLLGRGVNVAKFLAECGAILIITDLKSTEQLKGSIDQLKKFPQITYVLGEHRIEDFQNCDMVIKAPGVPLDSIYIAEAHRQGILVEMDASLFAQFFTGTIIGITGTRGKSTTTHLIYHILQSAGLTAYLGGNVKGLATLPLLKKVKGLRTTRVNSPLPDFIKSDFVVLELDSWQCQGFGESKISPDIAVFTNFFPDHMNYYKNSMEDYFRDKANIFKFQSANQVLVAGKQVLPFIKKMSSKVSSHIVVPKTSLPPGWKLMIKGEHNVYNAMLAVEVARSLGIKERSIKKSLATFKGVEGRLELVKTIRGIKIYNDTNSTTPEAGLVALKTLTVLGKKNIILITGGTDKLLNMSGYLREIPRCCKAVMLLAGSGTERIKKSVKAPIVKEFSELKPAVLEAWSLAKRGDIVVMSPAFTSFGMFKNEYDRGDQFNKVIAKLK